MPTISLTNLKASQALHGEDVDVTLSTAESASLSSLAPGQYCSISGVPVYGVVSSVDTYGTTFQISPLQPNLAFASPSTPGYLAAGATILITT